MNLLPSPSNQFLTHAPAVSNAQLLRPLARSKRWHRHHSANSHVCQDRVTKAEHLAVDPEAKFRRYGAHFGGKYSLDFNELMGTVPRVRMRQSSDRQKSLLAELALVNERLAGKESWEIRQKLEHLKSKRKNWEFIYEYVTKLDATATLARIEEANTKVQELLSEEAQERTSVADLQHQLVDLQAEVSAAHQQLHLTQARVHQNVQRVAELKSEAVQLELLRQMPEVDELASAVATTATQRCQDVERALAHQSASTSAAPATQTLSAPQASSSTTAVRPAAPQQRKGVTAHQRGLQSSLEIEEGLKNFWYPAAFASQLRKDTPVPFDLFGQPWVLFRNKTGEPACVRDECAHRACPLSLGKVIDGNIQCAYHGWQYNQQGQCVTMPSTAACPNIGVSSMACKEEAGFVLVWPGQGPQPAVPDLSPPGGFQIHAEIEVEVEVEHGLLMENLLDLAHAPFTHTTTFARGWPIPDSVKFKAAEYLGGNWEPYPIDMTFQPPCCVQSTIGLAQPGKILRGQRADACKNHLHQLHVCLPSKPGHTRLLYRMSMDFMQWVRWVPGIQNFWQNIAGQVLGEDLVLVKGQQDRMIRGADIWQHPVSYDKLAVRYRRWRNSLDSPEQAKHEASQAALSKMSAGELFRIEEDCDSEQCEV